jgi:hypothetical protein
LEDERLQTVKCIFSGNLIASRKSGNQDILFGIGFEGRELKKSRGVPQVKFISFIFELSCCSQISIAVCHVSLGVRRKSNNSIWILRVPLPLGHFVGMCPWVVKSSLSASVSSLVKWG